MIRALLWLLIFAAGLAVAVVWHGRMHHLRAVANNLPDWTHWVAPDAGLRRGAATIPEEGLLPALNVRWEAEAPGADGWRWSVTLEGPGVALLATATVPFWPSEAVIELDRGSLDLGRILPLPLDVEGVAALENGELRLTDFSGGIAGGRLNGTVREAVVAGAAFGEGPLSARLDETGEWSVDLALSGGVSEATVEARGTRGEPLSYLLTVGDAPGLPEVLSRALSAAGRRDGDSWRVEGSWPP